MSFRQQLIHLDETGSLVKISKPIHKDFELSSIFKQLEPQPVLCSKVEGKISQVAGNLLCSKKVFASYFGKSPGDLIKFLSQAIASPIPNRILERAPCQDIVLGKPNLDDLPILRHFENDGGNYITSGVMIINHPHYGQNMDIHRCMQFSPTEMAVRVVRTRHFDKFLSEMGKLDVALCIGVSPNVLAAAAISVEIGVNELEIANALEQVDVVKAICSNLLIPADTEIVIEGTVYNDRRHPEGPFVDLTGTEDIVRMEPVFEVSLVSHRSDPIWHGLLPGGLEHKLLMGMPREPTIFQKVDQVVNCQDVHINPGGCSWLHAIVQIDKQSDDDGKKAILAAFEGHRSLKHVFIVDKDIDIYSPEEVEWALATRFQGDKDLIIFPRQPGSSLDPSADDGTLQTTRLGFDLTTPLSKKGKSFKKVIYPAIDINQYLG